MSTNPIETLAQLFRSHGVVPDIQGEWLYFPAQRLRCSARIPEESQKQRGYSVQLDVILVLGPGKNILQGVMGLGATRDEAVTEAINVFASSAFHVILAAFFPGAGTDRVTYEEWVIGGLKKQVILGNLAMRGQFPSTKQRIPKLVSQFEEMLKARTLSIGTHWVRLYFGNIAGNRVPEVIVDNKPDQGLQEAVLGMDWPTTTDFYSVMLFLIIRSGLDVSQALATFSQSANLEDEQILEEFLKRGASPSQAERLVAYLPMAFGRALIEGMGPSLTDCVTVVNPRTNGTREITLQNEPIFVEAFRIAKEAREKGTMARDEFMAIAMRSAEGKAINQALLAGSKAENLVLSNMVVYLTHDDTSASEGAILSSKRKAWWQFWR